MKFVGLRLQFEMTKVEAPLPPYKMIAELPSCAYDIYTRIGLKVLTRLMRGVEGAEAIKDFFKQNKVKSSQQAIGESLFFVEGGRISGELIYAPLSRLEQKVFAHQFGLPMNKWLHLRDLTRKALEDGVIDREREIVLDQFYGCSQLQLF